MKRITAVMDTVVILAYFNFSNSESRYIALVKSLACLRNQKVDIILVCYGLDTDSIVSSQNLKIIKIPSASVIWQKERFYNVALSHLNEKHKYVVWADADLLFSNKGWEEQLKDKLENYRLVQIFNRVEDVKLENGHFSLTGLSRKSVVTSFNRDITVKDYFSKSGISLSLGCNPGFGWAAKAATIREIGFPDFMILGGGDKVLLASAMGYHSIFVKALFLNHTFSKLYHSWGDKVFDTIEGRVSYLENTIYHIVQGDYKNRRYSDRHKLIQDDKFAIADYLTINEYGAWQWRNKNNEYAVKIRNYFDERGD
ncbi:MAG: hypothetical protein F6K63_08240 [Moorea sp. SIO1G6]|uniref:hypothetical protein n=1 Tax=Moorena sp. SIO1G6 TaxID=2607840 RepID=UPI0013C05E32|nr:hypothetical protein [Moorena sp. SIO1G6]NET64374.1 hypothetical protein [Moorena sp. SIO1G6]